MLSFNLAKVMRSAGFDIAIRNVEDCGIRGGGARERERNHAA